MDFQEKSTFPGGTRVRHCFPLEIAGMAKTERRAKAGRFIALVGLSPNSRSVTRPSRPPACASILVMHEPFASLDDQTRLLLSDKMLQIQHELSQTALLITHNITEAVQPSDRILVMARRRNQSARPGTSKISSFTAFGRYVAEIWSDHREEAARRHAGERDGRSRRKRLITVVGQCTRGSWRAVSFGFVWSNEVGQRCLGAPFGGATQSSTRREECSEKILLFTAEKNIHIKLRALRQ